MQAATFSDNIWFAIAEPSRRKLIDILLHKGESSASQLAQDVPFTRQAVTKHLKVLQKTGLIRQRKAGREVRFSLEPQGMARAADELAKASAMWDARLQKIKQMAETIENEIKLVEKAQG